MVRHLYFFIVSFVGVVGLFAQTSQTYTTSGTWICPEGVTSVTVQCWGAGGGGGGNSSSTSRSGGGGGGGAYAANNAVTVTPGTSYNIVVGAGGAGGAGSSNGSNGGSSTFNSTTVVAAGGSRGTRANPGAGGAGGTVASSTGTTRFAGGNGANGSNNNHGGGGGGGAGTGGAGNNASNSTAGAGTVVNGGDGGNGATSNNTDGLPGNSYGGGGGGCRYNGNGGNGADGLVIISWVIPNEDCASAVTLTPSASCNPSNASSSAATGSGGGCGIGNADDDLWFKFVATATSHFVYVDGAANFDAVVGAYNSCGGAQPTGGSCVNATGADGTESLTLTGLTIGATYYVEVHDFAAGGGDFTICICDPPPSNDDPCSATVVTASSTCSYTTYTNSGATPTTAGSTPAPGCGNYQGGDVWFQITAPSAVMTFDTQAGVMTDGAMAIYRGSCGSLSLIACDDDSGPGFMPSISRTDIIPGETIWIRMWEYGNDNNGTFDLCVTYCAGPSNDLPCNATPITLGTVELGDNSCSGNSVEPSTPACWSSGTYNTIWYSFVAPASGKVNIRTAPNGLAETQIALYSGTCGTSLTYITCNDNAPSCGSTTMKISEIQATGLTAGSTYYVSVDGNNNLVGTFAITAVDGNNPYPTSSGQSCSTNISVCNSTMSIGDPGYQGVGFTCDYTGAGTCTSGERGSSWYTLNISTAGNLIFNIVPNNYVAGNCNSESDYDFVLWKIAGSGAVSCASIATGATPVACNYSAQGVTGMSTTGNATTNGFPNCFDVAYEPSIAAAAGDVYVLVVQNYSGSTSGYSLDLSSMASGVLDYTPPTSVTWTGGAGTTAYDDITNWGGCAQPSCAVDAVVSPSSSFQPNITAAMGTVTVKDLTIDPGSTLTLSAGAVLKVCGSITNNGTIVADATSTILFNDDLTIHTINGSFTGSNRLGNLVITDVPGGTNCTVTANVSVGLNGSFTTSTNTSIFNLNGNTLRVAGDFNNASVGNTFTGIAGSTIEFDGSTAQTYSPGTGGTLILNNVIMNHTGPGVTLSNVGAPDMIIGTSGVLTLTAGKIITPNNQEVKITNTANAAITSGNSTSYIEGNLRRSLAGGALGSFDFPVGHSVKGYQLANLNFTTSPSGSPSELVARFDTWGGFWPQPPAPLFGPECNSTYDQPYLDNGYWSIDVGAGSNAGLYDITLYNTNYTNAAAGFSIAKSNSMAPAWALHGTCVVSPVTAVTRTGLLGFSKFSTIQSSVPLPVELISFTGTSRGTFNQINWETSKEQDFDHFELESSSDGFVFSKINMQSGSDNSTNNIVSYSFDDYAFYRPITYYKLKMIDNDGSYKYSPIISIEHKEEQGFNVHVFPNPANNEVNIEFPVTDPVEVTITIIDVLGRVVMSGTHSVSADKRTVLMNIKELKQGSYIISCEGAGLVKTVNNLIINR